MLTESDTHTNTLVAACHVFHDEVPGALGALGELLGERGSKLGEYVDKRADLVAKRHELRSLGLAVETDVAALSGKTAGEVSSFIATSYTAVATPLLEEIAEIQEALKVKREEISAIDAMIIMATHVLSIGSAAANSHTVAEMAYGNGAYEPQQVVFFDATLGSMSRTESGFPFYVQATVYPRVTGETGELAALNRLAKGFGAPLVTVTAALARQTSAPDESLGLQVYASDPIILLGGGGPPTPLATSASGPSDSYILLGDPSLPEFPDDPTTLTVTPDLPGTTDRSLRLSFDHDPDIVCNEARIAMPGVVAVDPTDMAARAAHRAVIWTLHPGLRIFYPFSGPRRRILLDIDENDTNLDGTLDLDYSRDITGFFFTGPDLAVSSFLPAEDALGLGDVPGVVTDVFIPGSNRIRVVDATKARTPLTSRTSLGRLDEVPTVVYTYHNAIISHLSPYLGVEKTSIETVTGGDLLKGAVVVTFKDGIDDPTISGLFLRHNLRPAGMIRSFGYFVVRNDSGLPDDTVVDRLRADAAVATARRELVMEADDEPTRVPVLTQTYPAGLIDLILAPDLVGVGPLDFRNSESERDTYDEKVMGFTREFHYSVRQHFFMQTFEGHRLIEDAERIDRKRTARRATTQPLVAVIDTGLGSADGIKALLGPTGELEGRIHELYALDFEKTKDGGLDHLNVVNKLRMDDEKDLAKMYDEHVPQGETEIEGHGTQVASLISGQGFGRAEGVGVLKRNTVLGVAPQARLDIYKMDPPRVVNKAPAPILARFVHAIRDVVLRREASVINISHGLPDLDGFTFGDGLFSFSIDHFPEVEKSLDAASRLGMMIFVSAGNKSEHTAEKRPFTAYSRELTLNASGVLVGDRTDRLDTGVPGRDAVDKCTPLLTAVGAILVPTPLGKEMELLEAYRTTFTSGAQIRLSAPEGAVTMKGDKIFIIENKGKTGEQRIRAVTAAGPSGEVVAFGGTSAATPQAAALAALLIYLRNLLDVDGAVVVPAADPAKLEGKAKIAADVEPTDMEKSRRERALAILSLMERTADDLRLKSVKPWHHHQGFGRINVYRAVLECWNELIKDGADAEHERLVGLTVRVPATHATSARWSLPGAPLWSAPDTSLDSAPLIDDVPSDIDRNGVIEGLEATGNRTLPWLNAGKSKEKTAPGAVNLYLAQQPGTGLFARCAIGLGGSRGDSAIVSTMTLPARVFSKRRIEMHHATQPEFNKSPVLAAAILPELTLENGTLSDVVIRGSHIHWTLEHGILLHHVPKNADETPRMIVKIVSLHGSNDEGPEDPIEISGNLRDPKDDTLGPLVAVATRDPEVVITGDGTGRDWKATLPGGKGKVATLVVFLKLREVGAKGKTRVILTVTIGTDEKKRLPLVAVFTVGG